MQGLIRSTEEDECTSCHIVYLLLRVTGTEAIVDTSHLRYLHGPAVHAVINPGLSRTEAPAWHPAMIRSPDARSILHPMNLPRCKEKSGWLDMF